MSRLNQIQKLIDKGLNAYHIAQTLMLDGKKVWSFGGYYTTGPAKDRVAFFHTDSGVKCKQLGSA